jgi:hypothetical protein
LLRLLQNVDDDTGHVVAADALALVQVSGAVLLKNHLCHTCQPFKFAFVPRFLHFLIFHALRLFLWRTSLLSLTTLLRELQVASSTFLEL